MIRNTNSASSSFYWSMWCMCFICTNIQYIKRILLQGCPGCTLPSPNVNEWLNEHTFKVSRFTWQFPLYETVDISTQQETRRAVSHMWLSKTASGTVWNEIPQVWNEMQTQSFWHVFSLVRDLRNATHISHPFRSKRFGAVLINVSQLKKDWEHNTATTAGPNLSEKPNVND